MMAGEKRIQRSTQIYGVPAGGGPDFVYRRHAQRADDSFVPLAGLAETHYMPLTKECTSSTG